MATMPPSCHDHRITMTITGSQISGSAACNGYGGEIAMGADGLHLENLAQTEMACVEPAAMAAEAAYMAALVRVREIVRDGDELVARGDGVELRFASLPPPPTADLVGTELGARHGARRRRRSVTDGRAGDARAERGRDIHGLDRLPQPSPVIGSSRVTRFRHRRWPWTTQRARQSSAIRTTTS